MQISWHGLSCFEITTKTPHGEATLVINPYDNETGLRFPRTLEAQTVLISHDAADANNVASITGTPFVIRQPGEYEVKDVFVFGIAAPTKDDPNHVIYRIESEEMHLAHLGALDRILSDSELEQLRDIDLVMIPVGGARVMGPKIASEVIERLEPRVVIPMTYAIANVKEKLGAVEDFYKVFGGRRETMNKYKVSRKDLPEEDMLLITIER